jgi:hypothetical protein
VIDGVSGIEHGWHFRANRQARGEAGAIVFGGIRDVAPHATSAIRYSRPRNLVTGSGASEPSRSTVVWLPVSALPGDIVFADETGVCFAHEHARRRFSNSHARRRRPGGQVQGDRRGTPVAKLPATCRAETTYLKEVNARMLCQTIAATLFAVASGGAVTQSANGR